MVAAAQIKVLVPGVRMVEVLAPSAISVASPSAKGKKMEMEPGSARQVPSLLLRGEERRRRRYQHQRSRSWRKKRSQWLRTPLDQKKKKCLQFLHRISSQRERRQGLEARRGSVPFTGALSPPSANRRHEARRRRNQHQRSRSWRNKRSQQPKTLPNRRKKRCL